MAKRRTKKQKVKAQERKPAVEQGLPSGEYSVELPKKSVSQGAQRGYQVSDLYGYDTRLIRQDLQRTVIVSAAVLAIELGIYIWIVGGI